MKTLAHLSERMLDWKETRGPAPAHKIQEWSDEIREALAAVEQAQGDDETYKIGYRDGYNEAVQDIDVLTGGDGEYRYCTDHDPDRHTPDAAAMKQRIEERFDALQAAQPAPQGQDALDLLAHVYDNLADMPISEEWAHKTAGRIYELLERTPEMHARRAALKTGEQP